MSEEILIKSITRIKIEPGEILAVRIPQEHASREAIRSIETIFKRFGVDQVFFETQGLEYTVIKDQSK